MSNIFEDFDTMSIAFRHSVERQWPPSQREQWPTHAADSC